MRILFLSATLGDAYGQERIMRETNHSLRALGHQTFYVADSIVGPIPENDSYFIIPDLSRINLLSSKTKLIASKKALGDILDKTKPDLVHFIDQIDFRLMNFLSNQIPCFFTAHTVAPSCPSSQRFFPKKGGVCTQKSGMKCFFTHYRKGCLGNYKSIFHRIHVFLEFWLKKQALKKFQAVGAISPYLKICLLKDGYSSNQIVEIFNPVKVSLLSRPLFPDVPAPLLVTACRLVSLKGIDSLLRSLKTISKKSWHLWIFGEGPEEKKLKELTKELDLSEKVTFKGRVSSEVFHSSLLSARAFIQPNRGPEGFGLSVAEAQALGVPVITYDVPALNDLVQHDRSGFVVPLEPETQIVKPIEKLLEDAELAQKMGREGKALSERFSPEVHLQQLLSAYQKCIERFRTETSFSTFSYGVHFKD